MGVRESHEPGMPSWVDVTASDIAGARAFYSEIFGWDADVATEPEAGGYTMFTLDGVSVAGGGPSMAAGMPDNWTLYMTVTDIDTTGEAVDAAGGSTMVPPMDIFDSGRMAVFADDQGTPFAAWQPMNHIGAGRVNDVGCFCWNELATNDLAASTAFYGTVFGWKVEEEHPGANIYSLGGRVICGAHTAGEGEPPFWSIWFTVADCDATCDRVTSLGGSVMMPPNDMSFGRGAVVAAPGGAVFGVAALSSPDD